MQLTMFVWIHTDALRDFLIIKVQSDGGNKHIKNSTMLFNYVKLEQQFRVSVIQDQLIPWLMCMQV